MSKPQHTLKQAIDLANTLRLEPPVKWDRIVTEFIEAGVPLDVLHGATNEALAYCEAWSRIAGYLDSRYTNCGDNHRADAHTLAVDASNTMGRKVRKALGRTYPDSADIHF